MGLDSKFTQLSVENILDSAKELAEVAHDFHHCLVIGIKPEHELNERAQIALIRVQLLQYTYDNERKTRSAHSEAECLREAVG